MWILLKSIKTEFITKNCPSYQQLQDRETMRALENTVEERLKIEPSDLIFENITEEELETAAEMFVYLTSCSASIKSWFLFKKRDVRTLFARLRSV